LHLLIKSIASKVFYCLAFLGVKQMNKEKQQKEQADEFAGWGSIIQPFPWAKDLPEVTGR
jgi:hypothetical protein